MSAAAACMVRTCVGERKQRWGSCVVACRSIRQVHGCSAASPASWRFVPPHFELPKMRSPLRRLMRAPTTLSAARHGIRVCACQSNARVHRNKNRA
eukprot:189100-Rhodomonas_salina.2